LAFESQKATAVYDTSLDDTLLVPRLPPIDPPRELPATFAHVRVRHWPWVAVIIAVLALAYATPIDFTATQQATERARQADDLLPSLQR
jgi:hypothetical protein